MVCRQILRSSFRSNNRSNFFSNEPIGFVGNFKGKTVRRPLVGQATTLQNCYLIFKPVFN